MMSEKKEIGSSKNCKGYGEGDIWYEVDGLGEHQVNGYAGFEGNSRWVAKGEWSKMVWTYFKEGWR